jgi:hypothetical protein
MQQRRAGLSDTLTKIVDRTGDAQMERLAEIARRLGW